jgi:hypothetical protein
MRAPLIDLQGASVIDLNCLNCKQTKRIVSNLFHFARAVGRRSDRVEFDAFSYDGYTLSIHFPHFAATVWSSVRPPSLAGRISLSLSVTRYQSMSLS